MVCTLALVLADEVAQYFNDIPGKMPEESDPVINCFENPYTRRVKKVRNLKDVPKHMGS